MGKSHGVPLPKNNTQLLTAQREGLDPLGMSPRTGCLIPVVNPEIIYAKSHSTDSTSRSYIFSHIYEINKEKETTNLRSQGASWEGFQERKE